MDKNLLTRSFIIFSKGIIESKKDKHKEDVIKSAKYVNDFYNNYDKDFDINDLTYNDIKFYTEIKTNEINLRYKRREKRLKNNYKDIKDRLENILPNLSNEKYEEIIRLFNPNYKIKEYNYINNEKKNYIDYEKDYPGDSVPFPYKTKEQLDKELEEYMRK